MAKHEDYQEKSLPELEKLVGELTTQINKGAMELKLHRLKDTNVVKKLKIQLARVNTAMTNLKLEGKS